MTEYTYNENNQLLQAGESTFEYDDNGNIIREIRPNEEREYVYDAANRLRAVMFGDESYVLYGYDGLDRKVTRESGMWRTLGNPHDGGGHLGQWHGPPHDGHPGQGNNPHDEHPGRGNNPDRDRPERGFEREDHPGQGNAWGINRRGEGKEKMEVVESRYFYEGMSHVLHKEYKPSGSPLAEFYVGPNNRVVSQKMFGYSGRSIPGHDPSMKTTGGLMFYHFDGMSSVSELTDRHGDVIQHYRHDAFGALFTGITAPYNTNSYTGHQYDQDVGLIDMRARWYDASIGRFLQEDTYPGTLDNPLSQNRYAYVMNNPMNFWDPTGRVPEEVRNRENFRVTVHNGDEQERWYYTFQQYSTSTQESEKTRSVQEREIIYSWWETTIHSWEYEKQLRAIIDANGELNPVTRDPVAVHYEEISRSGITETYSAKDLMHDNFEELIKQGILRGHRTVLFSGTISMRNGEFLSRHLHVGDELQLDRLYDELVWGYSKGLEHSYTLWDHAVGIYHGARGVGRWGADTLEGLAVFGYTISPISDLPRYHDWGHHIPFNLYDKEQEFYEGLEYIISQPIDATSAIGTSMYDSFDQKVLHGDLNQRYNYGGYALAEGLSWLIPASKLGHPVKINRMARQATRHGLDIVPNRGYQSFPALKRDLGPAGQGKQWHHIVEQSQIGRSGFDATDIHNVKNIVSIPSGKGSVHSQISGFYSSKQPFTGGKTVREWLSGKSYQEQFDFGLEVLSRYGDVTPTSNGWIFTPYQ